MNRYQKQMAQYNRRIPVYKYPVMFRLKESDLVKLESRDKGLIAIIKRLIPTMGNVSVGQKESNVHEGKLADYYFYYDDVEESDQERKTIVLKEFQSNRITVAQPMLKNLRRGIDYELYIGEGEYIYKPRYQYEE